MAWAYNWSADSYQLENLVVIYFLAAVTTDFNRLYEFFPEDTI
ncbi:hypothetical protein [Cytobacillus firmus]|nr:hypothetical protein [Cytobacillus firmus]